MRVTVTGGAGFIGSHLVDRLIAEGCQVQVVDDLSTGLRSQVPADVDLVEACITSPMAAQKVRAFRPEAFFHLAAQVDLRVSVEEPAEDARINVVGTVAMLEAARLGGALTRFVLASSAAVYGEQQTAAADEQHPRSPCSAYGSGKLAAEHYVQQYHRLHGLSGGALRFANVYGPRQSPKGEAGVIAIFARRLAAGQPLAIFGDGSATRDYLYVADVVDGLWRMGQALDLCDAVNLGTEVETSVNQLAASLQQASGKQADVAHESARPGEVPHSLLHAGLARKALGWEAQIVLADGLAKVWASAQAES